jgi:acyl-CoA thioesterase-1
MPQPGAAQAPAPSAAVDDKRPTIVAVGDSLTAGYGVENGLSYPDYLQKELDARGYKYRVVNDGVSADTTSGGLERVGHALSFHPAIVILELGGNDGLRGLPVALSEENLDKMIAQFKAAGASVLLVGITLPRNYGADYITKFDAIYPKLAKKHQIPLVPFLLQGVAMMPGLMQQDGIHALPAGNKIMAGTVLKSLEPLLKK